MFITLYLFLEISENKKTDYLIPIILTMIMQCKCYKVYQGYNEFDATRKAQKDKKTSFTKESVEMQSCIKQY